MKYAIAVLILSVCFWGKISAMDVLSILEYIPPEDREDFVRHYAQRGYELLTRQEEGEMTNYKSLPDEFAISLYNYVIASQIICFPDGTCIDIGDVGIFPKL